MSKRFDLSRNDFPSDCSFSQWRQFWYEGEISCHNYFTMMAHWKEREKILERNFSDIFGRCVTTTEKHLAIDWHENLLKKIYQMYENIQASAV